MLDTRIVSHKRKCDSTLDWPSECGYSSGERRRFNRDCCECEYEWAMSAWVMSQNVAIFMVASRRDREWERDSGWEWEKSERDWLRITHAVTLVSRSGCVWLCVCVCVCVGVCLFWKLNNDCRPTTSTKWRRGSLTSHTRQNFCLRCVIFCSFFCQVSRCVQSNEC